MRGLIRLIVLLIILAGGYWAYYVFASADPRDKIGVEINKRLPISLRQYACETLKARYGNIPPPEGCAEFAAWGAAPGTPNPATTSP